ncbi:LmbE family N-acetylglucosaminyl deacetylase [Salinibacter ruber]|uniref:PIG-L deacetylase family protein n=1 Tax=Salinibacter ruber TaxID=146919 RepID=UPI0021673905|nr:PIG-L family deacetylase [Salinibacter ruber]MCS3708398.1 LmbE family N-acetylglucosaminyl deacetylase [Salinibacter ruber]MCS3854761.1 LmbE family N-acetylglucosaminyl deacetylase [Salinibacter ruber]MCS4116089.1 LmbE family N-acetylglucosaminyl deacetylase [Salinibacter ruber]MCS4181467.1 LmbE family N-acetylglucosaminyl deacetylase [Salinibacter ruber]
MPAYATRLLTGVFLSFFLFAFHTDVRAQAPSESVRVLFIGAHPDDVDLKAGGTAALLAKEGHAVKFVSLTNGDAGHYNMGGGMLAKRRRAEAKEAARRLRIDEYEVLHYHDGELMPTLEVRRDVIRLIREWDADVVVGHRPNDYHPDHRYAGRVVQDAAYMVQVPNVLPKVEPTEGNPAFLYFQDRFQKPYPFEHDIVVAIDDVVGRKVSALDAHESQFYEWLPWVSDALEEVPEDDSARQDWLRERWTSPMSDAARDGLEKWYDDRQVEEAQYAESFQVAEYGHQPTDEEIQRLFPMLAD